ncbi:MAG: endonuclease III domain-containing protein [Caldisericaceae bacterium]
MKKSDIESVVKILEQYTKQFQEPIIGRVAKLKRDPYRILIGTILSLRTKDQVTGRAAEKLFAAADNPQKMTELSNQTIEKLIYPVAFYHRKARQIIEISNILIERYSGSVPDSFEELLTLPGVGNKTANLVLNEGFNKEAICVDTHVHRISNRLGWVKTKDPLATEISLEKILPRKYWMVINPILVTFGQNVCKPISPFCSKCPVNDKCPRVGVNKHR